MGRFAAVTDRLDVMLFAGDDHQPHAGDFYDSLNDKQKTSLERTMRQLRRSGRPGDNS